MNYSLIEHNWCSEQIEKLKSLLTCQEIKILAKECGGNSVVYCVEVDGQKWAVKLYPPYAPDQRDRLAAELKIYQLLNQQQISAIPLLKAYSESERWLIIDWKEGSIPQDYSTLDIEQAVQFIRTITQLNSLSDAKNLPQAAEACLSLTILIKQIDQRFQRLKSFSEHEKELADFLIKTFHPVFEQYCQQALDGYHANNMDPDLVLPLDKRSLIPADFGFHNAIRDKTGKLYFFDFDYFGWDDPVKLLADILWHPKMHLSQQQKQQFIRDLSAIYKADALFLTRFKFTWPLFGLRWVLILLNEFIPVFWQNRKHANAYQNQAEAKMIQLNRAKALLLNVQQIGYQHEFISETSI